MAAAVQQRIVRASELWTEMTRVRRHRFRKLILLVLADIDGGAHSLAEIDFARLCRRAGLPAPSRQRVRTDSMGRRRYLDVAWDQFRLVVEIDGMFHMELARWMDDSFRGNEISLDDWVLLRFPAVVLRTDPERVLAQVRHGLINAGWRPPASSRLAS
jgi:hypothetical protein